MCAMVKSRYITDGHPTFNDGILIMGPYKPPRTWVDEFIPYLYGNNGSLDPIAHIYRLTPTKTNEFLKINGWKMHFLLKWSLFWGDSPGQHLWISSRWWGFWGDELGEGLKEGGFSAKRGVWGGCFFVVLICFNCFLLQKKIEIQHVDVWNPFKTHPFWKH